MNKNAIVAGGYRLLKLDTLDNRSISDHVLQQLTHATSNTPADAVVFSDFRHGIFNRRTIPTFDRGDSGWVLSRRRQPGRQSLGQYHRVQKVST